MENIQAESITISDDCRYVLETPRNNDRPISMDNGQQTATLDDLSIGCKFVSSTKYSSKIIVGCQGFVIRFGSFADVPLSRWEGFISGLYKSVKEYDDYDDESDHYGRGPNYCISQVGEYIKIVMGGGDYRNCCTHSNITQVIFRASEFIPLLREHVKKLSLKKGFTFTDYYKYTDEIDSDEDILRKWYKIHKKDEDVASLLDLHY